MNAFLLNVLPNQNFGDAIAVQDLRGNHVWNFVQCYPPNQNPGVAPEHIYIYNLADVIVSYVQKNTEITIKVNYTKDKAS